MEQITFSLRIGTSFTQEETTGDELWKAARIALHKRKGEPAEGEPAEGEPAEGEPAEDDNTNTAGS